MRGLLANETCRMARKLLIVLGAAWLGQEVWKLWLKQPLRRRRGNLAAIVKIMIVCAGIIVVIVNVLTFAYEIKLRAHSITGRPRVKTVEDQMGNSELKLHLRRNKSIFRHWRDSQLLYVGDIFQRLLLANMEHYPEISSISWTLSITEIESIAFASPSGRIMVCAGMLRFCRTADELALVLGHEIAHVLHQHTDEKLSMINLNNTALIILAAATAKMRSGKKYWAIKYLTLSLMYLTAILLLERPFGRMQELEADSVGMGLAARACYNVTDAISFWSRKWELLKARKKLREIMWELFRTHPNDETRIRNFRRLLPASFGIQNESSCFSFREQYNI